MLKKKRTPKSLSHKLNDLDANLFTVREHWGKLGESASHLKVLSAELRTLVCLSSGTEGLLWRLVDKLKIDDRIFLHVPGDMIEDHPLAQGLQFFFVPIMRGGEGDPRLIPYLYSLREVIKQRQAIFVGGNPFTHEYLIKAVAQQMGTAHEDDGLEQMLIDLGSVSVDGVKSYTQILAIDAELTLEIGERVLENAEKTQNYERITHKRNDGDISIVVSLCIKQKVFHIIPLFTFNSYIGDIVISASANPCGIEFSIKKHNEVVGGLVAKYPDDYSSERHFVFVFSYSSTIKKARTIVDGTDSEITSLNNVGWVHAGGFTRSITDNNHSNFVKIYYKLVYERLLSSDDSMGLSELPPNGYGLLRYSEELDKRGGFPD